MAIHAGSRAIKPRHNTAIGDAGTAIDDLGIVDAAQLLIHSKGVRMLHREVQRGDVAVEAPGNKPSSTVMIDLSNTNSFHRDASTYRSLAGCKPRDLGLSTSARVSTA